MNDHDNIVDAEFEEIEKAITTTPPNDLAPAAIQASDVLAQLDAAHRYPRSIQRFLSDAKSLVGLTKETAAACIYSKPRAGGVLTGPSIRLAEQVASAWGNLQLGARVVDVTDEFVIAEAVCWDMQTNTRFSARKNLSILGRDGKRFKQDMIQTAGDAACSIALRNAIFRVVPRAYVDAVYNHARRIAVGDAKTFESRRAEVVDKLRKLGITDERILARANRAGVADITVDDLEVLIGLGTAIKEGSTTIDEAFPALVSVAPPEEQPQGQRIRMRPAAKPEAAPSSNPAAA